MIALFFILTPLLVVAWFSLEFLASAKIRVPFGVLTLLAVGGTCYFIGWYGPEQELLQLRAVREQPKPAPAEAKHVLEDEALWFWFADGGDGRKMNLMVKLDDRVLYETVIPIFHAPRASKYSKGQEKRICFEFKAARKIVWSGYKDQDQTTKAGQNIYCDIWLAGADPGAMILGVGFRGPQDNYMNTLAIAYPDRPEAIEIAKGLVIATAPVSGGGLRTPSSQKIPPPRSTGSVLDEVEHSTKR